MQKTSKSIQLPNDVIAFPYQFFETVFNRGWHFRAWIKERVNDMDPVRMSSIDYTISLQFLSPKRINVRKAQLVVGGLNWTMMVVDWSKVKRFLSFVGVEEHVDFFRILVSFARCLTLSHTLSVSVPIYFSLVTCKLVL